MSAYGKISAPESQQLLCGLGKTFHCKDNKIADWLLKTAYIVNKYGFMNTARAWKRLESFISVRMLFWISSLRVPVVKRQSHGGRIIKERKKKISPLVLMIQNNKAVVVKGLYRNISPDWDKSQIKLWGSKSHCVSNRTIYIYVRLNSPNNVNTCEAWSCYVFIASSGSQRKGVKFIEPR
jgi:hypothetical protein